MRSQQAKEQGLLASELHLPPPLHPDLIGSHLLSQSAASISPFTLSHSKLMPALVMNVITHWTNQSIYPPPLLINSLSLCRANLKEWIQQLGVNSHEAELYFSPTDAAGKTAVRQVTAGFSPLLRKLTSKQTDNLLVPGLELSSKAVAKKRLEAFSIS